MGADEERHLDAAPDYQNGDVAMTVITPTRLHQPVNEAPTATTVITAEMLRLYGVRSIPEALRFVPGMAVTQPSGNDFRLNYHGTNILVPRRMSVLVDGVPLYQALQDRVDWTEIPVAIEDIDRIEVVRGTNSAAYGPNSMLAVINILTKHPADVPRAFVFVGAGSRNELSAMARVGFQVGPTIGRLTVAQDNDKGYEALSRVSQPHDSTALTRVGFRSVTSLNNSSSIDLSAWHVSGVKEVPFADIFQVSFPDQRIND
ncbi:MAG: TonB-dependent receptor plug domain-containing protein, partial [Candidatus Methylophosphatis roskildensis]